MASLTAPNAVATASTDVNCTANIDVLASASVTASAGASAEARDSDAWALLALRVRTLRKYPLEVPGSPFPFLQESKSPVVSDNNNVVTMAKDDGDETGSVSLTVTPSRNQEKSQRQHPIAKLQGKEFEYLVRQNR